MGHKIRKAVFPVAGLGTRFLPATKAMPKEMLTVVDKPVIQYALEEARAAGIEEFIFVTGRNKTALEDHFDYSYELQRTLEERGKKEALEGINSWLPKPGQVASVRQQLPLGLGHAVLCAKHLVGNEPFAVILPDDLVLSKTPCMKQLVDVHEETSGNVVAVVDVPREHTKRYGILDVSSDDGRLASVKGLVEKPDPAEAPSTLSIIGRYILTPAIFDHLEKTGRGAGGEIQLTDAMVKLLGQEPFHGLRFEGKRYDCGDKLGFLEANIAFGLARADVAQDLRRVIAELT
ncbi:UTP--glucose-1-phosphate uridylyltransferase [Aliidongia dinghuensis]|uniref:UTP--glucose-1-phosphate uridylyltransferase n=1 Tax=Aliidongia dinghuensis TaxID=1867774 RepID=A0A8J3E239_9PROT|nr:UTP--glucose-1-phosphate uridylyltransferase GalU [Aliidongia dinghuensis]GGF17697.1 UTP--glucose-1-phosphate uridylyltransferase [Aliidongia dinghuensis]